MGAKVILASTAIFVLAITRCTTGTAVSNCKVLDITVISSNISWSNIVYFTIGLPELPSPCKFFIDFNAHPENTHATQAMADMLRDVFFHDKYVTILPEPL